MQRIDGPTVSATLPAPRATGTGSSAPAYFTRGDPIAGVAPTTLDADWANMIQEELLGPVLAAGIAPDKGNHGQLLAALQALFAPKVADGGSAGAEVGGGQLSVPLGGGIILKAGQMTGSFSEQEVQVPFARAFPSACIVAIPVAINSDASSRHDVWAQLVSTSPSSFTAMLQYTGTSNDAQSNGVAWVALGN